MEFRRGVVTPASTWRALILYGANAATYKFAFGTALLEHAARGADTVSLEQLAPRYAELLCEALQREPRQGTASRSRFLDALRRHNKGELDEAGLVAATVKLGFANVVDAFPQLDGDLAPVQYYEDRRKDPGVRGLVLRPALLDLAQSDESTAVAGEVGARWRLVETAWATGLNSGLITAVGFDEPTETLFIDKVRRRSVTGVVPALNGYQDGRCAYCNEPMHERGVGQPIVEHVLPFTLMQRASPMQRPWPGPPLDAVWNLVLACLPCNSAKAARPPAAVWMPWLITRNDDLIASHHPLRQTLMAQTGATPEARRLTVVAAHAQAFERRQTCWTPPAPPMLARGTSGSRVGR